MKKTNILIICLILTSVFLYAQNNNLIYSYEYNRFGSGKRDVLIGVSVNLHHHNYKFRNTSKRITEKTALPTFGLINLDLTERFKGFSLYQGLEITSAGADLSSYNGNISTVVLRTGIQRDTLWVISNNAITIEYGGAVNFRLDKTKSSSYRNTFMAGLGVKIGLDYPLFNHSKNEALLYANYQGDLFVLQNATTANGGFSVKIKDSILSNTFSVGIKINVSTLTNSINEKREKKIMEKITT